MRLLVIISLGFVCVNGFHQGLKVFSSIRILPRMSIEDDRKVIFERVYNSNTDAMPPLLYLPGLDGVSDYSKLGLSSISEQFNIWRMIIPTEDRSTFTTIASYVIGFLSTFNTTSSFVVVGESFGGLLATYIALRARGKVSKIILINPATSFDQTLWPVLGTLISNAGPAFALIGTTALALTVVEPYQIRLFGQSIIDRINSTEDAVRELGDILSTPERVASAIPAATLRWRLSNWLRAGNYVMEDKYKDITTPTLVLCGIRDRLLPSAKEGYRLQDKMSNALVEVIEFPSLGHAMLDGSQNLSQILDKSKIFGSSPAEPVIEDYYPSDKDIAEIDQQLAPIFKGASAVFFSRGADGSLIRGLQGVPTGLSGRPVLFVGNHQLYGADMPLLIRQFLKEKDTMLRGLAHPLIFEGMSGAGAGAVSSSQNQSSMKNFLTKWGAVKVSPSSLLELLKMNASVLLFPGGAREAYHYKGEEYKLFWPEKTDFVRLAALYKAIIVPFAAVGAADSFRMIIDGQEALDLPVVGERFRRMNKLLPKARPGAGVSENFATPLSLPLPPSRNYFLFQQPFDTAALDIYDKKASRKMYEDIRGSVEEGLQLLLSFRENDPYKDFLPRTAYELATGEQAPTASLNSKTLTKTE